MPTLEELQSDTGFMSATPAKQIQYLSENDPGFKAAPPEKQAAFLAHATKQPTGAEPYAPAKDLGGAMDVAGEHYEKGTGVGSALGRLGTAVPAMARSAYHAVADAPKDEEEQATENAAGGIDPTGGRLALAAKRMILDPSIAATQHVNEMAQKQEEQAKAQGKEVPLGGKIAKYAGRGMAAIPMAGPFGLALGERAGKGDVSGALTEAGGYALAPEVAEEAMPGGALPGAAAEGGRAFPVADAATRGTGTVIRKLGEKAPDIGAVVGGAAGALKGNPASAYFEMKGGHYAGKMVGKPLEKLGTKMEGVGLTPEEKAVAHIEKQHADAVAEADKAAEDYHAYDAGREQGIPAPKKILDAHEKAQKHLDLIEQHLQAAREAVAPKATAVPETPITPEAVAAARPEAPTPTKEENDAKLARLMEQAAPTEKPAPVARNVKLPGQVQPETFPQEPTAAPRVDETTAMRPLAGNQGNIVGRPPRLLGAGTPEAAPAAPEAPKTPLGQILPPEKAAKPGRLGSLKVAEGGKVVDTEPQLQQKIEEGLQGTAKPVAVPPKGRAFEEVLPKHEEIKEEPAAKEEPRAESKKFEEVLPKHEEVGAEEGHTPEEMTKAEQVVSQHTDQDLIRLGKKYGVDAEDYDFAKRDDNRHRVERDDFVNDVLSKMPTKDITNVARLLDEFNNKDSDTWTEAERTNLSKAQRARAIMQEHEGGPKTVAGGAPETPKNLADIEKERLAKIVPQNVAPEFNEQGKRLGVPTETPQDFGGKVRAEAPPMPRGERRARTRTPEEQQTTELFRQARKELGEDASSDEIAERMEELKPATPSKETVGTKEGAEKDTDHFAQAKKELPNGTLSEQATRAQELKAANLQAEAHNAEGGSTIHPKDGNLAGKARFSVGGEPEFNKPELRLDVDGKEVTPKQMQEFNARPEVKAALKAHPDASVGSWYDKDADSSVIELVKTPADREAAIDMGKKNNQKAIYDLAKGEEIPTGGTGEAIKGEERSPQSSEAAEGKTIKPEHSSGEWTVYEPEKAKPYKDMTPAEQEELAAKGQSGGAPSKKLPTGDELIKKYGESNGDPAHTVFILKDGRGVANSGVDHDTMLGGKATDKQPPREAFVQDGNIRVRPRQGTIGGREVSLSIPPKGINAAQLEYIKKMSPQLRSGAVLIENGERGGAYKVIEYGKATNEALEQAIKELGPKAAEVKLPKLAEEHLLPEEKEGVSKSPQQLERFVGRMSEMPKVREFTDAAIKGAGERKWYQRSSQAFDAISKEAPDYFDQPGDRDKFVGLLASGSPQQAVVENMKEALRVWTTYVDNGRPTGTALEKLLSKSKDKGGFTLPGAKVPNAMKALAGEPLWPDITKNSNFKVPSFRDNLTGMLHRVTNDGWMALFSGLDANDIYSAHSYHPISVMTRAAAKELGWEPAEAQAAIWAFIKTLTEKGVEASEDPHEMRRYSEDFADIIQHDPETRVLLKDMGVNHAELDKRLASIESKPEPNTSGNSPTSEDSARRAFERVEKARGKGTIPAAKTGFLKFGEPEDEDTSFNPEKFKTRTGDAELNTLGKRKSPLGKIR
jgi:hypothetical protein